MADQKSSTQARNGIAMQALTSAKEVVVPSRESSLSHAFEHPWFCPEIDWPNMLWDKEEAAAQAAVAASRSSNGVPAQRTSLLENVCSLPIFAVDSSGTMIQPPQVLGVLQASNKRNLGSSSVNAKGFLETDVSQIRIIARTVGIAIQNASSLTERLDTEMALRDVLDGYKRASDLLHWITDPPRTLPAGEELQGKEHRKSDIKSEEMEQNRADQAVASSQSDADLGQKSIDIVIRHMACAAAEACGASIANVALVIEGHAGGTKAANSQNGSSRLPAISRADHLRSPITARPMAQMPSGGTIAVAPSDPEIEMLGIEEGGTDEKDKLGGELFTALRMGLDPMRMDTAEHVKGGFDARPIGPVSMSMQDHVLRTQIEQEETLLLEDQAQCLQIYSLYGKSLSSAECLQSLSPVRGITGCVVRTKQPIRLEYAADHPDFDPLIDSKPGMTTASLLSVPVTDSTGRVRAVVTVCNRFSAPQGADSKDSPDCPYKRPTSARSRRSDGVVGFEGFNLADQLALKLLAQGFVSSLICHEQLCAQGRIQQLAQTISEKPTLLAAVSATQNAVRALCRADRAVFFFVNHSRGECVAAFESAIASANGDEPDPRERSESQEVPVVQMAIGIGKGLVGRCARTRWVVMSGGDWAGADSSEDGDVVDKQKKRREGEEEGEEDEKVGERKYREWEAALQAGGAATMAVPFVTSRDGAIVGERSRLEG